MDKGGPKRFRTTALFHKHLPLAVLSLRRGRRDNQLIRWNLQTNMVETGQWMIGDVHLCDLSPDGNKLIYFAAQRHKTHREPETPGAPDPLFNGGSMKEVYAYGLRQTKQKKRRRKVPRYMGGVRAPVAPQRSMGDTWTAVSTLPYFTAHAIWPAIGTWTGGGIFKSSSQIVLYEDDEGLTPRGELGLLPNIKIESAFSENHRETPLEPNVEYPCYLDHPRNEVLRKTQFGRTLQRLDWSHHMPDGSLFLSGDGRIFCVNNWREDQIVLDEAEVETQHDFTGSRFEAIKAPDEALKW